MRRCARREPTVVIDLSAPPLDRAVENMRSFDRLPADWQRLCKEHGIVNAEDLYMRGFTASDVRDYMSKRK